MDNEIKGTGNSLNYKYRMHDPRLGRFFAVDPLAPKYPHNSPYAFSENVVINAVELEGLEKYYTNDGECLGQVGDDTSSRVMLGVASGTEAADQVKSDINVINHINSNSGAGGSELKKMLTTRLKENSLGREDVAHYNPIPSIETTFNNPKTPSGPYIKVSLSINAGPHTRSGERRFGIGERIELGAFIEIASIEFVGNTSEQYININIINSSNKTIIIGGNKVAVGGKLVIQQSIVTNKIQSAMVETSYGPLFMQIDTTKDSPVLGFALYDNSKTFSGAGVPISTTFSVSIENITTEMQQGDAATGYQLSYRQAMGWAQTQEARLKAQHKKKLRRVLNNYIKE